MDRQQVLGIALALTVLMGLFPPYYESFHQITSLTFAGDKPTSNPESIRYEFLLSSHERSERLSDFERGLWRAESRSSISWPRLTLQLIMLWAAAGSVVLLVPKKEP